MREYYLFLVVVAVTNYCTLEHWNSVSFVSPLKTLEQTFTGLWQFTESEFVIKFFKQIFPVKSIQI